jgi:ATP-dependent RNA helicase RhlE
MSIPFDEFNLNKQLLTAVKEAGYEIATPIQEKAIPLALAGHDVLGIAQTGTGKTAAYTLPLLMKTKYAQGHHPRALILAPTRELAVQIDAVVKQLSAHTDLRSLVVYGGLGPKTQIEQISKGLDIIIATPGRLLDLYIDGHLVLKEIKTLVLDEADRMMDMGFMPQLRRLLEVLPRKRQNLLFSATMMPKVIQLTEEFLEDPVTVEVSPQATPVETVSQAVYEVPNRKTKLNLLLHLLQNYTTMSRVMVFTRSKTVAENVAKYLDRKIEGEVKLIHGNKGQNTRMNSLDAFREGNVRVLVATDVAARGLDVIEVSHVVNFEVPQLHEDYVHRIGRTGRAHHTGASLTFCTEAEKYHIEKIEKLIRMKIPGASLPPDLKVEPTPREESQEMAQEIDRQKRKENPDFQGAFHLKARDQAKLDSKPKKSGKPLEVGAYRSSRKPEMGKDGKPKKMGPGRKKRF